MVENISKQFGAKHTFIVEESNQRYAFDIVIPSKKLLIEVNGDYWHCNPRKYEADYFHRQRKQYAHEIWEYDKQKKMCAEKKDYRVMTLWECDVNIMTDEEVANAIK